jgi:cytochrome c5
METEVHIHEHPSPIKTPKQLVVVVVAAFVVPVVLIVMIVQLITGGLRSDPRQPGMDENAVAARIKPVGEVNFAGAAAAPTAEAATGQTAKQAAAAPAAKSGEQVYQSVCGACHGAGLLSSPKLGDKAAWRQRIAQGNAMLYDHAIKGIRTMPAKGGNPALADGEVKAAVDYMVGKSK